MYIASKTFEIWQEYDSQFYQFLNDTTPNGLWTRKLYYIGTTLPDMFNLETQRAIREVVKELYEERDVGMWGLIGPLYIEDEIYEWSRDSFIFNGPMPNENLKKLGEMVQYAKNQGWGPIRKALIYGAFFHVVADLFCHMFQQPSIFGYGRNIENELQVEEMLLKWGEHYYEKFTPTYIDDWNFIKDVFKGYLQYTWEYVPGYIEFYSVYSPVNGNIMYSGGWQHAIIGYFIPPHPGLIWDPVYHFIKAAQEVNYLSSSISTQALAERLGAYMQGWAILIFGLMGYEYKNVYEVKSLGALLANPQWSFNRIITYFVNTLDRWVNAPLQPIIEWWVRKYIRNAIDEQPLPGGIGIVPARLGCLKDYSYEWTSFFEDTIKAKIMWECVSEEDKQDSIVRENWIKWINELRYWQKYGTAKNPRFRSTYFEEVIKAKNFKNIYKEIISQIPTGNYTIDYILPTPFTSTGKYNVWELSRKAGILGGMYDINPQKEYYDQPGIIKMHFERNNFLVYTPQDIEREGPPTYIILKYDIVTFGDTRIQICGNKPNMPYQFLIEKELPGTSRYTGSIQINAQNLVNQDYNELLFEVYTREKNSPTDYALMFRSDYRDAFNSHPAIFNNIYYQQRFNNGDPKRILGQNPLENPLYWWPYIYFTYKPLCNCFKYTNKFNCKLSLSL